MAFAGLDARFPIALFPVRIETRLDRPSSSVQIRVYPDEILADAHDPSLTADEQQMGAQFWADAASLGPQSAWQRLVGATTEPRAAWIAIATDPLAPTPPTIRSHPWSRPATAPVLPSQWLAIAYRGGAEIGRATSGPVVTPLALTVDPTAPTAGNVDVSGGLGLTLDPAVAWTVDYARAVAAGMALSLPLSATDFTAGCDRLLVFGLASIRSPEDGAARVAALFDAHHYARGWAFVPQGTPTNDSRDAPSGYPPADPNGAVSFAVERGSSLAVAGGDGVAWAQALGLPSSAVAHIAGADQTEQQSAAAMTRALFAATWGYYLDTMMAPAVPATAIDALREYMVGAVRARGPLPAFRVGGVPYGVLPVSSLAPFQVAGQGVDSSLPKILRTARGLWTLATAQAPHIGRTNDADADLLDVMSMDASARAIRLRRVLGQDAQWNLLTFLGIDWSGWSATEQSVAAAVLASAGMPGLTARILSAVFADSAPRFRYGFVADGPLSEQATLDPNYITWIRTASVSDLTAQALPTVPNALLYRLLRYAVLTDVWREGRKILTTNGVASAAAVSEHELVGIAPGTEARPTPWTYLDQPVPLVTHALSLGDYLSPIMPGQPFRTQPEPIVALRSALQTLEGLPTGELERLTTETLDLAASRLDAWVTSLYTTRLAAMRAVQPTGTYVGAYAWLENVKPGAGSAASAGGYIHAPSIMHATAAAVLRSGYLSAQGTGGTPYAVALTSARVRSAQFVLEAVRQGQAVGAVFGTQVEAGLHQQLAESLIAPLRALYPLVANKVVNSGQPADAVAGRNVVDGLQLRTAWVGGTIPWGTAGLPASGTLRTALETVLGALDDTVDAVADVLLAESVFQIVRGSTDGASATLDAMAQGVRPADPAIVHAPGGGTDLTHRVAIVLGGAAVALPSGWVSAATPRAAAEPRLDAWVGSVLGSPANVRCRVTVPGGATHEVSLDALSIRPLDVLAMSAAVSEAGQVSELDLRIIYAALGDTAPAGGTPTVDYSRAAGWSRAAVRTVPEWLVLAAAVSRVIGAARGLAPQDLVRPADATGATGVGLAVADAEARATAAQAALGSAITMLGAAVAAVPAGGTPSPAQLAALRMALRMAAAFGVSGAYPVPGAGVSAGGVDTTVLAQAVSVLDVLTQRQAAASAAAALPASPPPTDAARVAAAVAVAGAVFGRDMVFLAGCTPPPASTMSAALAASASLVGDAHAVGQWVQTVARVRTPMGQWRQMRLLAAASAGFGATSGDQWAIVQLPVASGARWGALPFATPADRVAGRLSLVLDRAAQPAAGDVWYGLIVDEWVELIPNATESTGLALEYNDPGAEAAQAVLVAVPPTPDATEWDTRMLADILNDTFDLAKARAVDLSLLGEIGQLLPAIYFAANANNDTITIDWAGALRGETTIAAATMIATAAT